MASSGSGGRPNNYTFVKTTKMSKIKDYIVDHDFEIIITLSLIIMLCGVVKFAMWAGNPDRLYKECQELCAAHNSAIQNFGFEHGSFSCNCKGE
jgi:hypothetical protein